jgi:hypothetical protein
MFGSIAGVISIRLEAFMNIYIPIYKCPEYISGCGGHVVL